MTDIGEIFMEGLKANARLANHLAFGAVLVVASGVFLVGLLWNYVPPTWALLSGGFLIVTFGGAISLFWTHAIEQAFRGKVPP